MSTDDLRAHVLISWFCGIGSCYAILGTAVITGYKGLAFADVEATSRDLLVAVAPMLVALCGVYFSADLKPVRLTAGQRRVLLLISYAYVFAFMLVTAAMVIVKSFKLNHDAVDGYPAMDHYQILRYVQPLVAAPLFFLFGRGAAESRKVS